MDSRRGAVRAAAPVRRLRIAQVAPLYEACLQHGTAEPKRRRLEGTRFLSRLSLTLDGQRPLLLSSGVREDNAAFVAHLTNADRLEGEPGGRPAQHPARHAGVLDLFRGARADRVVATLRPRAVRHLPHNLGGCRLRRRLRGAQGLLENERAADCRRCLRPRGCASAIPAVTASCARPSFSAIPPRSGSTPRTCPSACASRRGKGAGFCRTIYCQASDEGRSTIRRPAARAAAAPAPRASVRTSNEAFNAWIDRSAADLQMMMTETPHGPVPVRRRAVVQHAVRPRRHHHRPGCCGCDPSWRAACWPSSPRRRRHEISIPSRTPSRARFCTRRARARWRRWARSRSAATTAASTRRRCSSCSPAPTTSAPATALSSSRSGRNVERALDWIDSYGDRDGDGFVEYARQLAERAGAAGLEGLARLGLPRRRHAGAKGRSRCARCRATSTPPSAARPRWPTRWAGRGARRRAAAAGASAARALRGGVLVRGAFAPMPWRSTARSGRAACARSNAGHCLFTGIASPERAARVAQTLLSPRVLLRLGRPHGGGGRGALQPDVVPQRLGLAARQRPDRRGSRALRSPRSGRPMGSGGRRRPAPRSGNPGGPSALILRLESARLLKEPLPASSRSPT